MKTYQDFKKDEVIESKIDVTCIGAFDGLHRGHIELIKKTKEIDNNFQIVTFNEIPKIYFDNNLKPLLDKNNRNIIFNEYKPTNLIYLKFDEINEFSSDEFLKFLDINLNTNKIVVGKDFRFGKNRTGEVNNIINYFGENNVILLSDYLIENEKVSSTKIRKYLDNGNIKQANKFLGRKYELLGTVVEGLKMGSKLGFPTANIKLDHDLYLPKYGVYGITCIIDNKPYEGILNIGVTPTVSENNKIKIETHIFDFDKNIYGENLVIQINQFIRDEIKFSSPEELVKQINIDISKVKNK
ncbi:MAG: bifunctional riboflavin kinase/FAD synthetase [Actinomycetota bacterium]|jgi:riboflavin kinase/FMN adenylyltransferase|nr:bifunctional riboflavin kinase/FAD synthetase [Actinomycetota bacterium]|tara:strand:+ start:159 stop:1052 length:894 start_codon:yes stop_codon:yes gene_type:complete